MISILRILTRGEGVQNLENLADVIYEWPLIRIPDQKSTSIFGNKQMLLAGVNGTALKVNTMILEWLQEYRVTIVVAQSRTLVWLI